MKTIWTLIIALVLIACQQEIIEPENVTLKSAKVKEKTEKVLVKYKDNNRVTVLTVPNVSPALEKLAKDENI